MTDFVRKCPGCKQERPEAEIFCGNGNCRWDLTKEPRFLTGQPEIIQAVMPQILPERRCENNHLLEPNDEMCFECGTGILESDVNSMESKPLLEMNINGWLVIGSNKSQNELFDQYIVERNEKRALLTYFHPETHPDLSIYDLLNRLPKDYVPELIEHGEWQGRSYEIFDLISEVNLLDFYLDSTVDLELIRQLVKSLGKILHTLGTNGIRHCNIRPENILINNREPLSLSITGFHYTCLSKLDLDIVTQPTSARYTAPEIIAGGVSLASDWWSLGMVILHLITNGHCFDGINEQAFRIHVVTRGISIPKSLEPSITSLLRGLLARDPEYRWQWSQIQDWLAGESVDVPSDYNIEETRNGPAIELNGCYYTCTKTYALAASEGVNWESAKDLLMRGVVTTWLEDRSADPKMIAGVRFATSLEAISDDFRLALAMMWVHPDLPLIFRGEIVNSAWLLKNAVQGYEIITGPLIVHLRQMNREQRICELQTRNQRALERAKILEIELDEETFRLMTLASSRSTLEKQWAIRRRLFPGSEHRGLSSLMERKVSSEEELIILLSATMQQFESQAQILNKASEFAVQIGFGSFKVDDAQKWFDMSRRDIYREIEERIINYSRCSILRVDEWADDFRNERRITLPKALVLLSVSKDSWQEPPRQQYVSAILGFFEKRTTSLAQRGPLVRMKISKSSPRVDLACIASKKPTPTVILEHLVSREEVPINIDRSAFEIDPFLKRRLSHLISHAKTYRRDTGIDSLYLGFPFIVTQDKNSLTNDRKPRIAPVLLWPIKIDVENGDHASILFDRDREDVRLNPALTGFLGLEEVKKWDEVVNELLGRSSLRVGDVIDAFSSLAEHRESSLSPLPNVDYKIKSGTLQLVCSAVFFHAEFMGQAIGEDLRQMRQRDPADTVLATALRINREQGTSEPLVVIPEKDRFLIIESDPSQEKAVFQARQVPGLLIEGPPGTGKSQTIVNIIGDSIGRKQTVLVICQKSAALEVLAKRLNSEGLGNRIFYITNVNKDRTSVINAIRSQLDALSQGDQTKSLDRKRNELAEKIEKFESEIDKHHWAIHTEDEQTGLSYRILLGQLIELENTDVKLIDVPALRKLLGVFNQIQLSEVKEICSPLTRVWLDSCFESNALENLKNFSPDKALIEEFVSSLFKFVEQENKRDSAIQQSIIHFDVEDTSIHQEWIANHDKILKRANWKHMSAWFHLFSLDKKSKGIEIIAEVEELKLKLNLQNPANYDPIFSIRFVDLPINIVEKILSLATAATAEKSFWSRFNLSRFFKLRRIQKMLVDLGEISSIERITQFRDAAILETQLRPIRKSVEKHLNYLYQKEDETKPIFLLEVSRALDKIKIDLHLAQEGILAISTCPRQNEVESIVNIGPQAYQDLINRYKEAFVRHQIRSESIEALKRLEPFFSDSLFAKCSENIKNNEQNLSEFQDIVKYLPTLSAYQEFRLRAQEFTPEILKIFAILREKETELKEYPKEKLEGIVSRLIAREALLAWKGRIEQKLPILQLSQEELSRKIQTLDESNTKMRELNQNFLAHNINKEKIRTSEEWDDITRLKGPRMRGLREIVERGFDLGLMEFRPVWLMNPDTASKLLPLREGMFDVVIFDEASQIPIENALPALYRAKRAVISGDEKQMPPTSLFMKHLEDDEDANYDDDEPDNAASETERAELEDTLKRREIKDYADLLALGQTVLTKTMLQIHYRSKYRELIAFSNAAFYGGNLSVPVRHPDSVIQNVRPIEVVRVDGIYENQTNRDEAEKVVELLAEKWALSYRPSIGVVTFNSKQADLIEDVLAERAENDPIFQQALSDEGDRQQDGEDMSFFVKNVENVQGDERDIIIFSSTFGRNVTGLFRRNFGLLGQAGGERRLNVAITRAREKVFLVTSMPIKEISDTLAKQQSPKSPRDFLQAYFEYATKLSNGSIEQAGNTLNCMISSSFAAQPLVNYDEDGFIRSVETYIKKLGLKPLAINENDAFGLDFVIEDLEQKRFGIGIECDAHRHPILETARAREIWRPKVLRKGIPHVHRVTSYAWYHHRNDEMSHLKRAIENALGVILTVNSLGIETKL